MTDQHQHRATPEQWALTESGGVGAYSTSSCLLELRDRIQLLEATQHAHIEAKARCAVEPERQDKLDRLIEQDRSNAQQLALQDQIRDGTLTLAEALEEIGGASKPVHPFTAKYLFTDGNIQQDSFCYDPSDSNSVSFDIANLELGDGCLKPGDNIKIAHRWGELPASGVYSTINYKVVSVSETENRAWAIRAVRVDTSDSEPAPTANAQQLTLVERVAKRLARFASEGLPGDDATPIASAVLCDVAEWLRAGAVSDWGLAAADLLHNEASR